MQDDESKNTENCVLTPHVKWAQRNDKLILCISLEDCKKPSIDLRENELIFKSQAGSTGRQYEITLQFLKEVDPKGSKYHVSDREITFSIKKKEPGPYWSRLLQNLKKAHWLKTDFDKWKDEDDSDSDGGDDYKLEDMMNSMGGLGQGDLDGGEADEEDSDDEDLPDLE